MGFGTRWMLVWPQNYCKCNLKEPHEATAEGSYDTAEKVVWRWGRKDACYAVAQFAISTASGDLEIQKGKT